jgi:hypothetical protein
MYNRENKETRLAFSTSHPCNSGRLRRQSVLLFGPAIVAGVLTSANGANSMGLFDFLRRPTTPDKFAALFMQELKRSGVKDPVTYDRDANRLLVGSGDKQQIINLTNFFKEYQPLSWSQRRRHLADRARLFSRRNDEFPSDFETARSHLRPKVWARAAIEQIHLQARADGGDAGKFDIPEYEIGSHLVASLVYDLPQMMKSINKEQLDEWGVSYYEALEIARENLEQTQFAYAQIGEGCYAFTSGDSYDACRLLLPSLMERLQVKGDLIAMVPNRDSLFVTGSDDPVGWQVMATLAEKSREQPRPMVPIPVRWDGDSWVDWLPEHGRPESTALHNLARHYFLETYADQKQLLDRIHEREGTDVFVASCTLVKKKDDSLYSYAVWANGVKTLLPQTEWLMFARGADDLAAIAPWEKAQEIVGRFMQPTENYPLRVLVDDFPDAEELKSLGKGEP